MARFSRRRMPAAAQAGWMLAALAGVACACAFLFPFFCFSVLGIRVYAQRALPYALHVQPVFLAPPALAAMLLAASFSRSRTFQLAAAGAFVAVLLLMGVFLRAMVFAGDIQWLLQQATALLERAGIGGMTRERVSATLGAFLRLDYGYYLALLAGIGYGAYAFLAGAPAPRSAKRAAHTGRSDGGRGW